MSKTLVTISRRSAIVICATAIIAVAVSGAILSTYLLPSHVRITSQPGISLFLGDTATNSCSSTALTTFDYGDVQQTQQKSGPTLCIKNSGGSVNAYILQIVQPSGQTLSSLSTQSPLPSGVALSWNFNSVAGGLNNAGCTGFSGNGNCLGISPGQTTAPLTLSLAVDSSASPQDLSFTIVFTAYSSQTG